MGFIISDTPVRMSSDDTVQVSDLYGPSIVSLLATPKPSDKTKVCFADRSIIRCSFYIMFMC